MVTLVAYAPFNILNFDLNRLYVGSFDSGFFDDSYLSLSGVTYRDLFVVDWTDGWDYFASLFGGPSITVDSAGTITGGTITGYAEMVWTGAGYVTTWEMRDVSISARAIWDASVTPSTDDDFALILQALAGNDLFVLSSFDDVVLGFTGHDTILGGAGFDILIGGGGNDLLRGGTDSDGLSGGVGDDQLRGGAGDDLLALDAGNDIIDGGPGRDTLWIDGPTAATVDLIIRGAQTTGFGRDTLLSIEDIEGGRGADLFRGSSLGNLFTGGMGADTMNGRGGADTLDGGLQDDQLFGGNGADQLDGRAGADVLVGGNGRDTMSAGIDTDRDRFVFTAIAESRPGLARDRIDQFDSGEDVIDLRAIDAHGGLTGDQAFQFSASGAAAHAVWTLSSGGGLLVRADVDGDAQADFEVFVSDVASLAATDFLL